MKRIWVVLIGLLAVSVVYAADTHQIDLKQIKKMTVQQMLQKGKRLVANNNKMYSAVLNSLSSSRKGGDSAKENCLRNVTPAMKGLVRIGQQSLLNLKELAASGARMDAESQFVKIVISNTKMMELKDMANQCGSANVKQVFEKGVHVEKEVISSVGNQDVVASSTTLTYQVDDPTKARSVVVPDRFMVVDQGNTIPGSDFY